LEAQVILTLPELPTHLGSTAPRRVLFIFVREFWTALDLDLSVVLGEGGGAAAAEMNSAAAKGVGREGEKTTFI